MSMALPPKAQELLSAGALFVVNHSAGKDSQAMLIKIREWGVPDTQILLIHADLGDVEWAGNVDHIQRSAPGLPLVVAKARRGLLQMVEERRMFPSPSQRQCTSDLKRGPCEREIRRYLNAHPEFGGFVVNCMGMRAEESASRARKEAWKRNAKNSVAGREWFDWLPIHTMTADEVFAAIRAAGQQPHPIYAAGMTRLSCCFCIMASAGDLTTAARLNPALYRRYVELEKRIGHTLSMSRKGLEEVTGIVVGAA